MGTTGNEAALKPRRPLWGPLTQPSVTVARGLRGCSPGAWAVPMAQSPGEQEARPPAPTPFLHQAALADTLPGLRAT